MTEDRTKAWMSQLAASDSLATLPSFDELWTRSRLEEEFERRRRLVTPFVWISAVNQSAVGLAFVAVFTWIVQLWTA